MISKIKNDIAQKRALTQDFIHVLLHDMANKSITDDFILDSINFSYKGDDADLKAKEEYLGMVKFTMHSLNRMVNDICVHQINAIGRVLEENKSQVELEDVISPTSIIQQKKAAEMCGKSSSWLSKGGHLEGIERNRNGRLYLKSFIGFLKNHFPELYPQFKDAYVKASGLKLR